MKTSFMIVAAVLLSALSGCASGTNGSPASSASLTAHDLVAAEWTGPANEPASSSAVNVIRGPSHCDWESSIWLHLARPVGADGETDGDIRQYVRDPGDVLPDEVEKKASLDLDANLPDAAEPTGYHANDVELWLGEDAGSYAVYVVFDDHVEYWPRTGQFIACG